MILEFQGAPTCAAPLATVWRCLLDPDFVARTTPGLQRLERLGDDRHRVHARVGAGAFGFDVVMDVEIRNQEPPSRATMVASGNVAGQPISLRSHVELQSVDAARTRIAWRGSAELGGALAGLGGTMLKAIAPTLVERFWSDFAARVERTAAAN